jgi:hypothetical protein
MTERRYIVRWGDLGCFTEPGTCDWNGRPVTVSAHSIQVSEGNPNALFTVICTIDISGVEECDVGGIIRRD